MRKFVILKLEGDLEQLGFVVTLEIWQNSSQRIAEPPPGRLPANPVLLSSLQAWRQKYRSLGRSYRINPKGIYGGVSSQVADCRQLQERLCEQFAGWLEEKSFQEIDKRLREELHREEEIQVLIRTSDDHVRRLPWHLWDVIERYPRAELALGALTSEFVARKVAPSGQVKILVIFGNSTGLDLHPDRQALEALPGAAIQFLENPHRQELNEHLWNQSWDILFFAGHSATEGKKGRIDLNATESLTLDELRYGLRQIIAQGLQLAIFNSCDGLGLAYELEALQIPQMIVMREPVPDRVAQVFLKQFLKTYSEGLPLPLAVRQAREHLQGLEGDFPSASWLPVLCQHPDPAIVPPNWQALWDRRKDPRELQRFTWQRWRQFRWGRNQQAILWISLIAALLTIGLRALGILQPLEMQAFDQMMRLRPDEGVDSNLTIIEITDADIAMQKQNGEQLQYPSVDGESFEYSLSNPSLIRLLNLLSSYRPRVIGLDLIRDFQLDSAASELKQQFQTWPYLIGICKTGNPTDSEISTLAPPPDLPITRVGFSNFFQDHDQIIRRQILGLVPRNFQHTSCQTNRSFSVQVALNYLNQPQIDSAQGDYDDLNLTGTIHPVLRAQGGSYQRLPEDWGGNQIVLNYRASQRLAQRYTLAELFAEPPNATYIQDKIVLIGVTAPGKDQHRTPYGEKSGVEIHAHMISQLINAASNDRPLIQFWSKLQEFLWIWIWALVGGGTAWFLLKTSAQPAWLRRVGAAMLVAGSLTAACFQLLLSGYWVPLIPALLSTILAGSLIYIFRSCWFNRFRLFNQSKSSL